MSRIQINLLWWLLLGSVTFILTGCTTYSENARMAMSRLKQGDSSYALNWSEKLKTKPRNHSLGSMESGRIRMLAGDFKGSRSEFEAEIDRVIEETESGPVFRVGSAGSMLLASTFADDTVRKYELSPYEIIQLLHYQTLNYILCGDVDGAEVEMRRTVAAQDAIADHYAKEIQEDQEKARAEQVEAIAAVQTTLDELEPTLERTRSSYENGLAWYFCGVLFEKQADEANAALCYRKAWELAPTNQCIRTDFLRMLRTQDLQLFSELVESTATDSNSLTRGTTEVIVLYEESLISQRRTRKIPVPIPDFDKAVTLISIDIPFYNDPAYEPYPLTLSSGGSVLGTTEPAVYLQSLAYQDLKEKMPGIVVRNITRAATKVGTQYAVSSYNDDLFSILMMVFNASTSIAATSDTRAWYSIPMVSHVYRGSIAAGVHSLQFDLAGSAITVPVSVADGETRLVWIAETGGITSVATATLSGKGLPPTFQQFNNYFYSNALSESLGPVQNQ